jgi:hypothetical protein
VQLLLNNAIQMLQLFGIITIQIERQLYPNDISTSPNDHLTDVTTSLLQQVIFDPN